eukprot:5845156-Pyramimonas_sp.AAC.1
MDGRRRMYTDVQIYRAHAYSAERVRSCEHLQTHSAHSPAPCPRRCLCRAGWIGGPGMLAP